MKTLIDYLVAILKLLAGIAAYMLVYYLVWLIHPLAPPLVTVVAVLGFVAHIMVDLKRMDAKYDASTAAFKARTAELAAKRGLPESEVWDAELEDAHRQLEATCARIRAGHAEPLSFEEAPLTRYREDDPVQRI